MATKDRETFQSTLRRLNACGEARDWAADQKSALVAWRKCERGDWLLWILAKLAGDDPTSAKRRKVTLAACACARLVLKHVPKGEHRPRKAIKTAEAFARGKKGVTLEDVRAARQEAWNCWSASAYAAAAAADAYASAAAADAYASAAAAAAYAAAADAAAAAAAAAAASASARSETLKKCAEIVREHFPTPPRWKA